MNIDGNILLFIQDVIRHPALTPFFVGITKLGNAGMIWIVFSILLLLQKKTRKIGMMGICALLLSLLVNNLLLKNLVGRVRPYEVIPGLVPLIPRPKEYSFPSGHSASSFAAASVFYRTMPKKFGIPIVILAFLISVSRLYVGVHYPSDVLVGIVSGIELSYVAEAIVRRVTSEA